ncbi:MAG: DEAD/DEAH box helicase [Candidatus Nitrohelix vancouverensis]|uniref:DEAD/DEAH box helicase n=1 Tax=Candidatus Nitrohelix vancouverensis TaxID=2705534 RepID=A0A7T0C2S8_9BACT|nr:MAG: DEAD/DEAH box helicase [Candidatus Nitrohelix vancouverensis]
MNEQMGLFGDMDDSTPVLVKKTEPVAATKPRILYFDLETQKGSNDVGGWSNIHKMLLAVGVVWDSREDKYFSYFEKDAPALLEKLRSADLVVGFNVIGFDYTVMQPYAEFDLAEINTFDMILDVKKKLGFRLALNHLAQYTLDAEKSADGLVSLQWYKEYEASGDPALLKKIESYCIQDVQITRDLFLFGADNGYVNYQTRGGKNARMEVDWKIENFLPAQKKLAP